MWSASNSGGSPASFAPGESYPIYVGAHRLKEEAERSMSVYHKSAYQYPWNYSPQYQYWSYPYNPYHNSPSQRDFGSQPFVANIAQAAKQNNNFRVALWTGEKLQVTLMSIPVGEDIGLEVHPTEDQFIRIEDGQGLVRMGGSQYELDFEQRVHHGYAIMVPAGKWHNLINTGNRPLKLYTIYAPPEHPFGTVHPTKASAEGKDG